MRDIKALKNIDNCFVNAHLLHVLQQLPGIGLALVSAVRATGV